MMSGCTTLLEFADIGEKDVFIWAVEMEQVQLPQSMGHEQSIDAYSEKIRRKNTHKFKCHIRV